MKLSAIAEWTKLPTFPVLAFGVTLGGAATVGCAAPPATPPSSSPVYAEPDSSIPLTPVLHRSSLRRDERMLTPPAASAPEVAPPAASAPDVAPAAARADASAAPAAANSNE